MPDKYSLDALMKFLDFGGEKGLFNQSTAQNRKTAAKKILSILDDDEKSDIRNLDLDDVFAKFMNLSSGEYTPQSLQSYRSRINTAISDFLLWSENKATFKPAAPQRRRSSTKPNEQTRRDGEGRAGGGGRDDELSAEPGTESSAAPLIFPIPMRDRSVIVRISNLPSDLTVDEAEKISAVLQSLRGYLAALTNGKGSVNV